MAKFGHLLGRKASGPLPDIAVCLFALGNPGREYAYTRHNIGWLALDRWIERQRHRVKWEEKGPAQIAAVMDGPNTILLVKPQTFMNLSGRAAVWVKRHYAPQAFLVIHDEMDCEFGKFKLAAAGGAGGHNGLRSLVAELGTGEFHRFKIGISHRGEEIGSDYVLGPFLGAERDQLDSVLEKASDWIQLYIDRGLAVATQELQREQRGRKTKSEPGDATTDPPEITPPPEQTTP